jgi:hypothetical protein
MHDNRERPEAVYLTKSLARVPTISREVVLDILHWCRHFRHDIDATWRLWQLFRHFDDPAVAQELLRTLASFVRPDEGSVMVAGTDPATHIDRCFSYLFSLELYAAPPYGRQLDRLFADWLKSHASFSAEVLDSLPYDLVAERFGFLLITRVLDVESDKESIERFLRSSKGWAPEHKLALFRVRETLTLKGVMVDWSSMQSWRPRSSSEIAPFQA